MIRMGRGILAVLALCCAWVGAARAEEDLLGGASMRKHVWQVRPEVSAFEYQEPGYMKEKGMFYGLEASYTYRPWADPNVAASRGLYLLRLEGRFAFGEVDYDGSLSDGTPYTMSDMDDRLFEFRVLGGRDFLTSTSLTTFYTGFGYRYLNNDLSPDPYGYERESHYLYVPFGLQHTLGAGSEWSLTPCGEFDFLFLGIQESHLGDLGTGYHDVTNYQRFGYGLRGSIRLQKRFDHFGLALDPFITYWNVNKSDDAESDGSVWCEPQNWSLEYGLRLIVAF
jgi:hypothetical protein